MKHALLLQTAAASPGPARREGSRRTEELFPGQLPTTKSKVGFWKPTESFSAWLEGC